HASEPAPSLQDNMAGRNLRAIVEPTRCRRRAPFASQQRCPRRSDEGTGANRCRRRTESRGRRQGQAASNDRGRQAGLRRKVARVGRRPRRGDRRLIVVDGGASQTVLFSPQGPLVREELDLLDVPGNTLWLENLLPAKPVAVGDRWRHDDQLLASLLGLDAVSQADVNSELKTIDADNARCELAGEVHGAVGGVATDISFKAKYRFDRKQRRIAWIGMLIKEK